MSLFIIQRDYLLIADNVSNEDLVASLGKAL